MSSQFSALKAIRISFLLAESMLVVTSNPHSEKTSDGGIWTVCCCGCKLSKCMIHHSESSVVESDILSFVSISFLLLDVMKCLSTISVYHQPLLRGRALLSKKSRSEFERIRGTEIQKSSLCLFIMWISFFKATLSNSSLCIHMWWLILLGSGFWAIKWFSCREKNKAHQCVDRSSDCVELKHNCMLDITHDPRWTLVFNDFQLFLTDLQSSFTGSDSGNLCRVSSTHVVLAHWSFTQSKNRHQGEEWELKQYHSVSEPLNSFRTAFLRFKKKKGQWLVIIVNA